LGGAAAHVVASRVQWKPRPRVERLLLDRGWRFRLGHAADHERHFGYGLARGYMKTGELFGPAQPTFSDAGWLASNLPHAWGVELPFVQDDETVIFYGAKPLGRKYLATSIGWYRRVFSTACRSK
jgi:beta-galactosidase